MKTKTVLLSVLALVSILAITSGVILVRAANRQALAAIPPQNNDAPSAAAGVAGAALGIWMADKSEQTDRAMESSAYRAGFEDGANPSNDGKPLAVAMINSPDLWKTMDISLENGLGVALTLSGMVMLLCLTRELKPERTESPS